MSSGGRPPRLPQLLRQHRRDRHRIAERRCTAALLGVGMLDCGLSRDECARRCDKLLHARLSQRHGPRHRELRVLPLDVRPWSPLLLSYSVTTVVGTHKRVGLHYGTGQGHLRTYKEKTCPMNINILFLHVDVPRVQARLAKTVEDRLFIWPPFFQYNRRLIFCAKKRVGHACICPRWSLAS